MRQVGIPELEESITRVLNGSDPLNFVNAFIQQPLGVAPFPAGPLSGPDNYWLGRICAVAELLAKIGNEQRRANGSTT